MTIQELKQMDDYEFECSMSEEYKDYKIHDEWGCAFLWLGEFIGVEYNFCIDNDYTACAIYKIKFNKDEHYMTTDYDTFVHYDIDFNSENWKNELENAMCNALVQFYNL